MADDNFAPFSDDKMQRRPGDRGGEGARNGRGGVIGVRGWGESSVCEKGRAQRESNGHFHQIILPWLGQCWQMELGHIVCTN